MLNITIVNTTIGSPSISIYFSLPFLRLSTLILRTARRHCDRQRSGTANPDFVSGSKKRQPSKTLSPRSFTPISNDRHDRAARQRVKFLYRVNLPLTDSWTTLQSKRATEFRNASNASRILSRRHGGSRGKKPTVGATEFSVVRRPDEQCCDNRKIPAEGFYLIICSWLSLSFNAIESSDVSSRSNTNIIFHHRVFF